MLAPVPWCTKGVIEDKMGGGGEVLFFLTVVTCDILNTILENIRSVFWLFLFEKK